MITHDEEQLNIRRLLYQKEERHLMEKLAKKKAKLKAAEARIRARISVRERKRRTRRLILIGSYMEHVTQTDPDRKARLMKELDGFLERDRDRELFDLDPNKENEKITPDTDAAPTVSTPPPVLDAPLPGWRPHHLETGAWGSIYLGDTSILPLELVGARITVQSKGGQSWTTTVTAVLKRSREQVSVTDSGRPVTP